jgi:ATP-binding cassette subfamily F protein 3
MSLVTASALTLAYGPRVLFRGAGFSIGPRDRVGLVGANGTGKSSLLRILAGDLSPDSGQLTWRRGARAGYLPQDVAELPAGPVAEVVLASVPGRGALEDRLRATEAALAEAVEPGDQLELSQALADLHLERDHFEERHGRHRAERILQGLGFPTAELGRDTGALSGGWRMRAALAGLLLADPDLLLLDEPTNHLDVPTLTWLDGFLRASEKALLLISHDREFLNRQVDRILSLEPEGLRSWKGDYDDYRSQRALEADQLAARARRVEARRQELQTFIDRFGAKNTKATQAKSKAKMLARLEEVQLHAKRDAARFRFSPAPRSGREVLGIRGLSKAFGERAVYRDLSASILRGERVAVIGPNGAGKTTLLRLVAGELRPDAGEIRLGHQVIPGYFAQHHFLLEGAAGSPAPASSPLAPGRPHPADPALASGTAWAAGDAAPSTPSPSPPPPLDPARTVLETLWDVVPDRSEAWVRGAAGAFLFSGDDVEKPIGVLSGGERSRVALARVLLVPANLLLLDEPTNHLDLESSEGLIEALAGFEGTMLFVSHNRSFLNRLATRTWEVKAGAIADAPGNLDDWLYHQRQLEEQAAGGEARDAPRVGEAAGPEPSRRDRRRAEAEARNERHRRERPIREEIARLEARIAELEQAQKEAERALADPALYQDFARARPHLDAISAASGELPELYRRWEEKQAELEG